MKKWQPLISVCIPVFDTEPFLARCLRSVINQDFTDFEVVIVSDASRGRDENGRPVKKIVKLAQKECDRLRKEKKLPRVPFRFIEHRENRGILEVRRTMTYEAHGKYIASLDSDDEFTENALSAFYEAAQKNDADIVHSTFLSGFFDDEGNFIRSKEEKCGNIFYGRADSDDVFKLWIKGAFAGNLCGKLIEKSLLDFAFESIPYTQCNMADDLLIFFFLTLKAKRYVGIEDRLYRYRVNSGMSSGRKIDNLNKWKMICTTSSVFTIISEWIKANPERLKEDEADCIRKMAVTYLASNICQMRDVVVPELEPAARKILCDYWGKSFVERIEKSMEQSKSL